jgi:hypothetical protein
MTPGKSRVYKLRLIAGQRRSKWPDPRQLVGIEPDVVHPAAARQRRVGVHFQEWHEHEGTLVHSRVRDDQVGLLDDLPSVRQDIDVDLPRSPSFSSDPSHSVLDGSTCLQKSPRRHDRFDLNDGVEEIGLRGTDRFGLVDAGGASHTNPRRPADKVHSPPKVLQTVSEIGAQAESGGDGPAVGY